MSDEDDEVKIKNYTVNIWPDFAELSIAFLVVIAVFYYTGLEISFEKNEVSGIYMTFGNDD